MYEKQDFKHKFFLSANRFQVDSTDRANFEQRHGLVGPNSESGVNHIVVITVISDEHYFLPLNVYEHLYTSIVDVPEISRTSVHTAAMYRTLRL